MTVSDSDNSDQLPSLEQMASPERLDQLMRVVKPQDWIPALAVGGFTAIALVWSVVGRIPMTVAGQGALLAPQRVVELQSPIAGQLETLRVQDGQWVKKDEVLAAIKPIELEEQLKQQRAKRQQLIEQAANTESLQQQRTEVERDALAATRASLMQRLQDTRALSPTLKQQALVTIQQQRQSLERRLQDAKALIPTLKDRWERRQRLAAEGALEQDSLVTSEREYRA